MMKVTIDTDRKVVEIDSPINIKDLIRGLKSLLGDEWVEYWLDSKTNSVQYPPYSYTRSSDE